MLEWDLVSSPDPIFIFIPIVFFRTKKLRRTSTNRKQKQ
nr:MAG TPA: hypothetical protein [Caudoviricetes sp.]